MIGLLFFLMIFFLLIRIPVGAGMLLSCLVVIAIDGFPPEIVAMRLFEGLFSFPILAVPLFYLIGELCNFTSITDRILTLARAMVGNVRAGLAHVSIVASILFSGISGSNTADTAAVGSIMIPRMLKAGYSKSIAVAVVAVGSTLGNIIPPSILMVIYGTYGNVSLGMLFLGGVVPGILIGLAMMALVGVLAHKYDFGKNDFLGERVRRMPALVGGWAPAGVPLIIIGGVVGGLFTATESAAIAIVYILFLAKFLGRGLRLSDFFKLLLETGKFTGLVMIMASAGSVFGWLLSIHDFPAQCVALFERIGAGRYTVMFFIFLFFVVMGTFRCGALALADHVHAYRALAWRCCRRSPGSDGNDRYHDLLAWIGNSSPRHLSADRR